MHFLDTLGWWLAFHIIIQKTRPLSGYGSLTLQASPLAGKWTKNAASYMWKSTVSQAWKEHMPFLAPIPLARPQSHCHTREAGKCSQVCATKRKSFWSASSHCQAWHVSYTCPFVVSSAMYTVDFFNTKHWRCYSLLFCCIFAASMLASWFSGKHFVCYFEDFVWFCLSVPSVYWIHHFHVTALKGDFSSPLSVETI